MMVFCVGGAGRSPDKDEMIRSGLLGWLVRSVMNILPTLHGLFTIFCWEIGVMSV